MRARPGIAVLCSGSGTNLQTILDATQERRIPGRVALVVSDQPQAKALKRAARFGVEAVCIQPKHFASRADFERAMITEIDGRKVKLVCLAGFMRILSPVFVRHYSGKMLNVHPALLPAFPGAHAIRDALSWGVKVTGVSVHLVDEVVDHGPIVVQEAVVIRSGDTESKLLARVHKVEHRLYPQAIRFFLQGRLKVKGRTVTLWPTR